MFLLTSCENFLKGAETAEELKEAIARANAKKVTVRTSVDSSDYGDIYPPSAVLIKGDSINVQFTKKMDVVFIQWICIDSSTGKPAMEAVTFSELTTGKNNAGYETYSVKVTLNTANTDLIIKPLCYFSTEKNPPVFKTLHIARTQEDALNGTNLITIDDFTHYAAKANFGGDSNIVAKNIQNHRVNKVWIYVEAEDDASGIASLEIKEQLIKNGNGTQTDGISYNAITNPTTNSLLNLENKIILSKLIEYNFYELEDGIVQLSFLLTDKSGNTTEKKIDLVKDTKCTVSVNFANTSIKIAEKTSGMTYYYDCKPNASAVPFATDIDGIRYFDRAHRENEEDDFTSASLTDIVGFEYGESYDNLTYLDLNDIAFEIKESHGSLGNGSSGTFYVKSRTLPLNVNPYKVNYLRAYVKDDIGNINICESEICDSIDIINCNITSNSLEFVLNKKPLNYVEYYYRFSDSYGEGKLTRIPTAPASTKGSTYKIQKLPSSISSTETPIANVAPGKYTFYCFAVSKDSFWSYSLKSLTLNKTSSGWFFEEPDIDAPCEQDIPSFTVNVDEPVLNAGTRRFHVNYQQDFIFKDAFTYLISYEGTVQGSYDKYTGQTTETDFDLPSSFTNYTLKCLVLDSYGRSVTGEGCEIQLNYDNIPPVISIFTGSEFNAINHKYAVIRMSFSEGGSGLKTNGDGFTIVKYLFSQDDNLLGKIDWNTNPSVKTSYYYDAAEAAFNEKGVKVIPDENYLDYMYFYVEDNNGNFSEYKLRIKTEDLQTAMNIEARDSAIFAGFNLPDSIYGRDKFNILYSYPDGESWTPEKSYQFVRSASFSYTLNLTEDEKKSFIRVRPWYNEYSGTATAWYSQTQYFYPKYYLDNLVCNLKDIMEGQSGLNILADQACLVHTFYSSKNLGSEADMWLKKGEEADLVQKPQSFTYHPPVEVIPAGAYYTSIVHFADGTVLINDVKQK